MQRLWILFKTQIKAWWRDPITALGGVIPSTFIMLAFGLLFGGKLGLKLVVINHDTGPYGQILVDTFDEVYSPLDNAPYYDLVDLDEAAAWEAFDSYHVDGVWVIPADFSDRLENGTDPQIEMHFSNYNDDRAKNHRIYSAEILWRFYEKIGQPAPPLEMAETYPMPEMIGWFPIISVGIVTMAMCLGAIFNMYAMTYKEQINRITLEYGLSPRSLAWMMIPKTVFALLMGLLTGTLFLGVIYFWLGYWPGRYLWAVWLLGGLVALYWIAVAVLFGLRSRSYMAGAIVVVLGAILVFFVAGGLAMVRTNRAKVPWYSWFFPNIYAVDPVRDLVLFNRWPVDWTETVLILAGFAVLALAVCMPLAVRRLRRLG